MKILHLVRALEMGGLEQVVIDLVNGMSRLGIECHLGCLNQGGPWLNRVLCAGVWEGHLDEQKPWRVVRTLRDYLDRHQIQLVNSHNIQPHFYGVFATAGSPRHLVHTKHGRNWIDGSQPRWRRTLWWWKSRQLSRWTDAIIAVSRDAETVAVQSERVPREKVRAILNGIDVRRFSPLDSPAEGRAEARRRLREQLNLPGAAFIIGSVGRLSSEKNYPLLVRSFAAFQKEVPEARLILVGEGESRSAIETEIARAGVETSVYLPGSQAAIPDWLRAFDVFCLSSFSEGTSIALLEAGACGLPALVTDVGGNAEIVRHGVSGWVVPPRDEPRYVRALLELWKRREDFERWGGEARIHVVRHYSVDAMVDAYLAVYRNVLAERAPFGPPAT